MLAVATGMTAGCKTGPSDEELALQNFQQQAGLVQQAFDSLQQIRTEIETAEATVAEIEAVDERKRSDEQTAELEGLKTQLEELRSNSENAYNMLQSQLSDLLNTGLNEYPEAPETANALKIYSDEALIVANDIVLKSGDYKKAMDHLAGAKGYYEAVGLEVYPALEERIAELDDWRFITQERYDAVKKGMNADDVKQLVGIPYYANIQEDEKRGIETWLYKKREGGAAAIYFKIKTGKVYNKNFEAVKTRVAEG
jgi:hypothetical protein